MTRWHIDRRLHPDPTAFGGNGFGELDDAREVLGRGLADDDVGHAAPASRTTSREPVRDLRTSTWAGIRARRSAT